MAHAERTAPEAPCKAQKRSVQPGQAMSMSQFKEKSSARSVLINLSINGFLHPT